MKNQIALSGFHFSFDPVREFVQRTFTAPFVEWRHREVLRAELDGLDDRCLADMGVSRNDIPAIVEGNFHGHDGTSRQHLPRRGSAGYR